MEAFSESLPAALDGWTVEDQLSESLNSTVLTLRGREDPERLAVLKILHPSAPDADIPAVLDRVRAAAGCPNTVEILSAFIDGSSGNGYILMPCCRTLYDYQTTHEMGEAELTRLAEQILTALEALHSRGLMHTDIKPENILVDDGDRFLLGDPDSLLPIGEIADSITREYVAPEQTEGKPVNETGDLYSLALLLYRFSNRGRLPFLPQRVQLLTPELRRQAVEERLSGKAVPLPAEGDSAFGEVLCHACAFRPEERYQNAAGFRAALESVPKQRKKKRLIRIYTAAVCAAVCIAVGIGLAVHHANAPLAEGSCGESAEFVLSKDGVLTVSGTGCADSYEVLRPYAEEITEIIVEPGITELGYCAFYMLGNLTEVSLPEGLETIGGSAFYNCWQLQEIDFPSTLKSIGDMSFTMCQALTEIDLPEGLESIGTNAFDSCTAVTELTLPDSLRTVGPYAFYCLSSLTSVEIPDGITSLGEGAFSMCSALTDVTIDPELAASADYLFAYTPLEDEYN